MTNQWSVNSADEELKSVNRNIRVSKSSENSTIGLGSIVKGIVSFVGPVRVDGIVEGDLVCSSEVSVSEAGKVKANVRADVVKVFGTVLGDISAETLIEIFSGAKVIGNIKAARVAIHDGVDFQGQCKMTESRKNIVQLETALPKDGQ